MAFSIIGTAIQ